MNAGVAYKSPLFEKGRSYAQCFGDKWVVFSAKYGFMRPEEAIENYNVTFKTGGPDLVTVERPQEQVSEKLLGAFFENRSARWEGVRRSGKTRLRPPLLTFRAATACCRLHVSRSSANENRYPRAKQAPGTYGRCLPSRPRPFVEDPGTVKRVLLKQGVLLSAIDRTLSGSRS